MAVAIHQVDNDERFGSDFVSKAVSFYMYGEVDFVRIRETIFDLRQ